MTPVGSALRHLCIVGIMGSGKTTVGRRVAQRLRWPMTDSDGHLQLVEGRTGREISEERGVAALHELERAHLHAALAAPGPTVICAAAAVIDDAACREALRDPSILVVWLTVSPRTAAARYDDQEHRPRFGRDPEAFLAAQLERRGARFRSVEPVEIPTDTRTPDELADAIVALVRAHGAGPENPMRPALER